MLMNIMNVEASCRASAPILILYKMTSVERRRSSRAGLCVLKSNLQIRAGLNHAFYCCFSRNDQV